MDVVKKSDLVDLVELSKAIARLSGMTNGEACDWLTTKLVKSSIAVYNTGTSTLPQAFEDRWRTDAVYAVFNQNWWDLPDSENEGMPGYRCTPKQIAIRKSDVEAACGVANAKLFSETKSEQADFLDPDSSSFAPNLAVTDPSGKHPIQGATFNRLRRAIEAFPGRYPDYKTKPPKLDDDVRPWLTEAGLAEAEAERRVFGAIIREHFKLLPDTLKSK